MNLLLIIMVDTKQGAIDLIRRLGLEKIKNIAKFGEQPYRAMSITILEIAGEGVTI